jgi:hypothetical protein
MVTSIRAVVAAVFAAATVASAATTNVVLSEVLGSWQGDDGVQFIELAITSDGSTNVSGATLTFTTGSERRSVQLTKDMTNGSSGSRILFATSEAADVLGLTPDFTLPAGYLPAQAGRICYQVTDDSGDADVVDCLAYGRYQDDNGAFGLSLRISPTNRALVRTATTGSNRADWEGVLQPTPQNNAGTVVTLATLCGDGHIDTGEQCDDTNLDGKTCKGLGYSKGQLACSQCHLDVTDCATCGNLVRDDDESEDCDDADLGGRTCTSLGFTGGDLACTNFCKFNTASCDATFYVPGGGSTAPECLAEWKIVNGAQRPGRRGVAPVRQACTDGNAECDADRATGTCTFTVSVCFDVDDARLTRDGKTCKHAPIARWGVHASGYDATRVVAAARAAVSGMAPSTVDGDTVKFDQPLDVAGTCSAPIAAVVTSGKTLVLKTRTSGVGGRPQDGDALKLVCVE